MEQDASQANIYSEQTYREIQKNKGWYIFESLLFILIGIFALAMPSLTAFAFEFVIGILLLGGGVIRIINSFRKDRLRLWRFLAGALYTLAGLLIFIWPVTGLYALIILTGILLLAEGLFDIVFAMSFRPFRGWGWIMLAGILSLILSVLVFTLFPEAGIFYLAIAIGLSFILYGLSVLALCVSSSR